MIRQTIFSISDNESNRILTGELFEISRDEFRVSSLDLHRVDECNFEIGMFMLSPLDVISL